MKNTQRKTQGEINLCPLAPILDDLVFTRSGSGIRSATISVSGEFTLISTAFGGFEQTFPVNQSGLGNAIRFVVEDGRWLYCDPLQ